MEMPRQKEEETEEPPQQQPQRQATTTTQETEEHLRVGSDRQKTAETTHIEEMSKKKCRQVCRRHCMEKAVESLPRQIQPRRPRLPHRLQIRVEPRAAARPPSNNRRSSPRRRPQRPREV